VGIKVVMEFYADLQPLDPTLGGQQMFGRQGVAGRWGLKA
jgi:hypothetical protein